MRYTIENYQQKPPFASFLPGIAGKSGTPLWCFYVNRGQCISAFGHSDKNHPILEFRPADQAYRMTGRLGFRTFIRLQNGTFREPFGESDCIGRNSGARKLSIDYADIQLSEEWDDLKVSVRYATLPGKQYPALLRRLEVVNNSSHAQVMDILDGLPGIVPCGINDGMLKTMSTTAAAWVETEFLSPEVPVFRIRASISDTVEVKPVKDCHFMSAVLRIDGNDTLLKPIVDPATIFGNDLAFVKPDAFIDGGLTGVLATEPALLGRYPSGFVGEKLELYPGKTARIYSIYGYAQTLEDLRVHATDWQSTKWYDDRFDEYSRCMEDCIAPFKMNTAMPNLDAYTVQTALDNTLRGGMPIVWREEDQSRCYHIYSRKHGDLERDYNDFVFPAQRYSAGFGNYRDMNQNRRIDVCINPGVGDTDIRLFMDLIQPDGYNPLIVNSGGFLMPADILLNLKTEYPELNISEGEPLHPGQLLDAGIPESEFPAIISQCEYIPDAFFGEGYWTDHWTYNLDLIEQYLRIFPDRETRLLFGKADYRWFVTDDVRIRPLSERFIRKGDDILPQSHLVASGHTSRFLSCRSTLFEKLCTLALLKCATLGYEERGLEMEAGRPGWCDALNGLPGQFGSSLVDSAELLRLLRLLRRFARHIDGNYRVTLFRAAWQLMEEMGKIFTLSDKHARWLARWTARDAYRRAIYACQGNTSPEHDNRCCPETNPEHDNRCCKDASKEHNGQCCKDTCPETEQRKAFTIIDFLSDQENRLSDVLTQASRENRDILPAYYRFEAGDWDDAGNGYVLPTQLIRKELPLYLEAAVKQMKLMNSKKEKTDLHLSVKRSPLYDDKLGMYVLNDTLRNQPDAIGRTRAFPDGWLENGSVWLHMEYKYLLELLRTGDGQLFWGEVRRLLIPFQNPDIYGRSPFENSSFIASSRYPVSACHGRGYVGRLSGATAEYLTIWSEFLLGSNPIVLETEGPVFRPCPLLPAWLFREDGSLEFILFGSEVRYENPDRIDLFRDTWRIESMHLLVGKDKCSFGDFLPSNETDLLRLGQISKLRIVFRKQ